MNEIYLIYYIDDEEPGDFIKNSVNKKVDMLYKLIKEGAKATKERMRNKGKVLII